ncbi:MAG: enoyl-CoA hydratase/isomerase family protein, partial [Candidatus Eremiobacteraeota bacterium]|nr:enoyl-CoA hydratase/isomerase family protein [Candidatus Eremiobacteraeota bacterium]
MESLVRVTRSDGGAVARVTLDRPVVRNALNAALIDELRRTFAELCEDPQVRAIILAGAGRIFCGGADIGWMRESLELSAEENMREAETLADMFRTIDGCEHPVIVRVQGAALAGGAGLCAVADVVIAAENAMFGFTETKLGLIPATIAPFVIA